MLSHVYLTPVLATKTEDRWSQLQILTAIAWNHVAERKGMIRPEVVQDALAVVFATIRRGNDPIQRCGYGPNMPPGRSRRKMSTTLFAVAAGYYYRTLDHG